MINLIKLHLKYLYSKTTFILISIICIFILGYLLIVSEAFTQFSYRWFYQIDIYNNYQNSSFFVFKLILPIVAIFLFGNSFLREQDDYCLIIIKNRKQRISYFVSKIVSIYILLVIIWLIIYILYKLIGIIVVPNYIVYEVNCYIFMKIFMLSIYYGNISLLIVQLINQPLSYVTVMIVYVTVYIMSDISAKGKNLIFSLLPILNKEYDFELSFDLVIIIFSLLLFVNNIVYYKKDL